MYARRPARSRRRNPEEAPGHDEIPFDRLSPQQAREVKSYAKKYTDWHWGRPATKVVHVKDPLVPNLTAIGKLESFDIGGETVVFPPGSWVGFDPKHPHERIHVILSPNTRESFRVAMKSRRDTKSLQRLAESTHGTHAEHPLPNLQAVPLGVLHAVTYVTDKGEEHQAVRYIHEFGKEHSKGIRPLLAVDVSGRVWIVGGSYTCPLAGITG